MSLDQRLRDAARRVAQDVDPPEVDLDAIRSTAHANRRARIALAVAAAILAVGLAGIPLLAAGRDTTAPQPAVSPRSQIIRTLLDSNCAADRCVRPNTYGIPLGQDTLGHRLRAKLTVHSGGWEADGYLHRLTRVDAGGAVVLAVYQPWEFAGSQPCDADGATRKVAPDATVEDVVRLLTTLPQFAVVDGPRAEPAFGRDTRHLAVRANRVTCPSLDDKYNLAHIYGSDGLEPDFDSDIDPGQSVLIDFWVLELDGKPVVVEARQEGTPDDAMVHQLDQVRRTLTFGIRQ